MPRKKLDIAYFNARADEFDSVTDKNRNEVMKVVAELAVYIKRQGNRRTDCLKRRIDDSMHCFFELFWHYGSLKGSPDDTRYVKTNLLQGLNKWFYGDLTTEIYAEYQKLFQKA